MLTFDYSCECKCYVLARYCIDKNKHDVLVYSCLLIKSHQRPVRLNGHNISTANIQLNCSDNSSSLQDTMLVLSVNPCIVRR